MYDIFFISDSQTHKQFNILKERFPLAKIVNTYEEAKRRAFTKFFWIVWPDLSINTSFDFNYQVTDWDKDYVHVFKNGEYYDGVSLHPKIKTVSSRELKNRFYINKKEIDVQASITLPYEIFYIDDYNSYLDAIEKTTTDRFWVIWNDIIVNNNFDFTYRTPAYDTSTYIFKNGEYYDGVCLFSKKNKVSEREFNYRFFVTKKEIDVQASIPKPFDIIFISYNEPQADQNYEKLKERFPRAKRIHGVTGIHQAHIEAAKLSTTDMFWVVDADAIIEKSFNFDFEYIPFYNVQARNILKEIVHVWRSQNPITGLEYGYGGVKLLPTKLTLEMDTTTTDMTTSISKHFKVMSDISNITAFNTDAYSTWRSAFRECVKLTINNDDESLSRLDAWCTLNDSVSYGFYAYSGALAGKAYGEKNASNKEALSKINDFTWLQDQWSLEKSQLSPEHTQ